MFLVYESVRALQESKHMFVWVVHCTYFMGGRYKANYFQLQRGHYEGLLTFRQVDEQ